MEKNSEHEESTPKCALYKILNLETGDAYFGISRNPQRRWKQHLYAVERQPKGNSKLYNAFRKYGVEAMRMEIVTWARNGKVAGDLERLAIYLGLGAYNINSGGTNGRLGIKATEETKLRQSIALKGHKKSDLTRSRMSKARRGISFTEAHKQALSLAHMGLPGNHAGHIHTEVTKLKMSAAKKGHKLSEATRQKMKVAQTARRAAEKLELRVQANTVEKDGA